MGLSTYYLRSDRRNLTGRGSPPGDGLLSRRQLLGGGAAAAAGAIGGQLVDPLSLLGFTHAPPRPIPGGFDKNFNPVPKDPFVHVLSPGIGFEMSTITDFAGAIAGSEIRGKAHGSDGTTYDFDTDMRLMAGRYVGLDGRVHRGAFGFI